MHYFLSCYVYDVNHFNLLDDDNDGAQGIELRKNKYCLQCIKYAPSTVSDSGFSDTDTKTKSEKSAFSEVRTKLSSSYTFK